MTLRGFFKLLHYKDKEDAQRDWRFYRVCEAFGTKARPEELFPSLAVLEVEEETDDDSFADPLAAFNEVHAALSGGRS